MANAYLIKIDDPKKQINPYRWLPTLNKLSKEQKEVLSISTSKDLLVYGAAGTGKTVLSIYRQKAILGENKKGHIIVYGNLIGQFISYHTDNKEIQSFYKFLREKINFKTSGSFGKKTYKIIEELGKKYKNSIDYFIVDEAQDFNKSMISFVSNYAVNLTMFSDNAQLYFDGGMTTQVLIGYLKDLGRYPEAKEIMRNYRNQPAVAEFADLFYDQGSFPSAQQEGQRENIEVYVSSEYNEMTKCIIDKINYYIQSYPNYAPTIGVLTQSAAKAKFISSSLKNHNVDTKLSSNKIDLSTPLPIMLPIQSAKGMEFDYVILADFDYSALKINNPTAYKKILFVAATRARKSLSIFMHKNYENDEFLNIIKEIKYNFYQNK